VSSLPAAGGLALPASPLKRILYEYLEEAPTRAGPRLVQMGIMAVIAVSVLAVVLETVSVEVTAGKWLPLAELYPRSFHWVEMVSVTVFTAEYLLRVFSITVDPRYARPFWGRVRFVFTPMALIDLVAILPTFFQAAGFMAARALRLVRIFRVFKIGHYSQALRSLKRALLSKRAELGVTVFVIGILLVLVSTVMYYAENEAQPDRFSSVPATMWWGIVTLTTVGYGDLTPVTPLGKLMGGVMALFGIGLVALPAGILGSAFIQELETSKKPLRCPHCGKDL